MSEVRRVMEFETADYWERRARDERAFAAEDRRRRTASVESILLHESNAREYDARAAAIRAKHGATGARS